MDSSCNDSAQRSKLPAGQRELAEFPRFGVIAFAKRPIKATEIRLEILGAVDRPIVLTTNELASVPRVTMRRDFHCAAGWSYRALEWSGYRLVDVWARFVTPRMQSVGNNAFVVLRGEDGFRTSLLLEDLLAPEVLIADLLNGQPLSLEHGSPLRIVAPAHYGYKSVKHLVRMELRSGDDPYRPLLPRFMEHPRARVAFEERGQLLPGWLLRYLFRPMIQPMIRKMKRVTSRART